MPIPPEKRPADMKHKHLMKKRRRLLLLLPFLLLLLLALRPLFADMEGVRAPIAASPSVPVLSEMPSFSGEPVYPDEPSPSGEPGNPDEQVPSGEATIPDEPQSSDEPENSNEPQPSNAPDAMTLPVASETPDSSGERCDERCEAHSEADPLPEGFVRITEVSPDILVELRYLTDNNFMGRPADGYEANTGILTKKAATALAAVQASLAEHGMSLVVYDAYRPTRAVADFVRWGEDLEDQKMKDAFYPDLPKQDILAKGFLARKSSHSRGSTVDLSVVSVDTGEPLDMGTPFDWFSPEADPDYTHLSTEQLENRRLLRSLMEAQGFAISTIEWWHFRLRDEPFPDTYFDFPVR